MEAITLDLPAPPLQQPVIRKPLPCTPQYLVTHNDLIKFGVDGTKSPKSAAWGTGSSEMFKSVHLSSKAAKPYMLPQTVRIISIFKVFKKDKKKYRLFINVNAETGELLEYHEAFSDISHFDPKTFPNKSSVSINKVGYWTTDGDYVSPKCFFKTKQVYLANQVSPLKITQIFTKKPKIKKTKKNQRYFWLILSKKLNPKLKKRLAGMPRKKSF